MSAAETIAIIDIGSNSVRLVVYGAPRRIPLPMFNEKVLAGLGSGLAETGRLPEAGRNKALAALRRFRLLIEQMKVSRTHVVATAAVREAEDGPDFVREVERIGFRCDVLSAEQEAHLAGEGVLSGIPDAHGTAADLGGGSLELVNVADGQTRRGISLPLGVLRVEATPAGERDARRLLRESLGSSAIAAQASGRALYLVGGSWRALARVDMTATSFPLPITHQYRIAPQRADALRKLVGKADTKLVKTAATSRLASLPTAAMLLALLVDELEPSDLVISTFGIREGLLYSLLPKAARSLDPLIEEARHGAAAAQRFGDHGELLDAWLAPVFDDPPAMRRLRLAACLLADVAWQTNPAFRADRAIEMALHENWGGVTPAERVILAQALSSSYGRDELPDPALAQLCTPEQLRQAHCWGTAMRLGQRLSGGIASIIRRSRLSLEDGVLRLSVASGQEALISSSVKRRLGRLAELLGAQPVSEASRVTH